MHSQDLAEQGPHEPPHSMSAKYRHSFNRSKSSPLEEAVAGTQEEELPYSSKMKHLHDEKPISLSTPTSTSQKKRALFTKNRDDGVLQPRLFGRIWSNHRSRSVPTTKCSDEDDDDDNLSPATKDLVIRKSSVVLASETEPSSSHDVEVVYQSDEENSLREEAAALAMVEPSRQRRRRRFSSPRSSVGSLADRMRSHRLTEKLRRSTSNSSSSASSVSSVASPRTEATEKSKEESDDPDCHFHQALGYLSSNRLHMALHHVERGQRLLEHNEASPLYWKLTTIQAEILGRREEYRESRALLEKVLAAQGTAVTRDASLYFSCGRLSVYLQDYEAALDYYTQELLITRDVSGDSLPVARIYHDLAKVSESGMGDWDQALVYYEQALYIEAVVYRRLRSEMQKEEEALKQAATAEDDDNNHLKLQPNSSLRDDLAEVVQQIHETKRCMARIQFSMGDIHQALRLSMGRFSLNC